MKNPDDINIKIMKMSGKAFIDGGFIYGVFYSLDQLPGSVPHIQGDLPAGAFMVAITPDGRHVEASYDYPHEAVHDFMHSDNNDYCITFHPFAGYIEPGETRDYWVTIYSKK